MKIEKYFDKQAGKELWKFDVTISGERIRRGKFLSRRDAEIAIAAERLIGQRKELGLPSPGRSAAPEGQVTTHRPRQRRAAARLSDAPGVETGERLL